jgi:hypothetical protein
MSIILLLSAAMGAAAPGPSGSVVTSRLPVSVGSWQAGRRGFDGRRPFRPGPGRHRPHRGRHGGDDLVLPYGAGGLALPADWVDPHGNGFFAGAGGQVRVNGGRAYYDYDRAYPYEWSSAAGGGTLEWRVEAFEGPSAERCTAEKGVRVCRGGR